MRDGNGRKAAKGALKVTIMCECACQGGRYRGKEKRKRRRWFPGET